MLTADVKVFVMSKVQHAWREPIYGAMHDSLRHWRRRIVVVTAWAAAIATVSVIARQFRIDAGWKVFVSAWGILALLAVFYTFIQRRIDLYDDRLVVVQGRGGNLYFVLR